MSQVIAPGKWHPVKRKAAKFLAPFVGFLMICFGLLTGYQLLVRLVGVVENGGEVSLPMLVLFGALTVVPTALGAAALFPNVVVPLLYRIIDKAGRDS